MNRPNIDYVPLRVKVIPVVKGSRTLYRTLVEESLKPGHWFTECPKYLDHYSLDDAIDSALSIAQRETTKRKHRINLGAYYKGEYHELATEA